MPSRRRFLAAAGAGILASTAGCLARVREITGSDLPERELSPEDVHEPYRLTQDHDLHPVAAYELGGPSDVSHHFVVVNLTAEPVEAELTLRPDAGADVVYERALELDPRGYASWRFTRKVRYVGRIVAGSDDIDASVDPDRVDCNSSYETYLVEESGIDHGYSMSTAMDCEGR